MDEGDRVVLIVDLLLYPAGSTGTIEREVSEGYRSVQVMMDCELSNARPYSTSIETKHLRVLS